MTVLRKDPNSGVWESGWDAFADPNLDNTFNPDVAVQCLPNQDCLLRTYDALPTGFTLRTGGSDYDTRATFFPSGLPDPSLGFGETFVLCDGTHDDDQSRRIIINSTGRARVEVPPYNPPEVGICP